MKPLNFDSILEIFEDTSSVPETISKDDERLDHPYVRMGLIVRSMDHYKSLSALMLVTKKEEWGRIEETVTNKYFNRLHYFVSSLDLSKSSNVSEWLRHGRPKVEWTLNKLIKYFEPKEEYEKCADIQRVLDFIKQNS